MDGSFPFLLIGTHLVSFQWDGKCSSFHKESKSIWKRCLFDEKQACMILHGILSGPGAVALLQDDMACSTSCRVTVFLCCNGS